MSIVAAVYFHLLHMHFELLTTCCQCENNPNLFVVAASRYILPITFITKVTQLQFNPVERSWVIQLYPVHTSRIDYFCAIS